MAASGMPERSQQEKEYTALARVEHAIRELKPGQQDSVLWAHTVKARWDEYAALRDVATSKLRSSFVGHSRRQERAFPDDLMQEVAGVSMRAASRLAATIPAQPLGRPGKASV